jgi:chemotaxis-related protein WspB
MLKIVFHLGSTAYSVPADQVKEILPAVPLNPVPGAPEFVAGSMQYRGEILPVIDLCRIVTGRPAAKTFCRRIMVIHATKKNEPRLIGLIAEGVTDAVEDSEHPAPADIENVLPSSMYEFLLNSATV